MEKIRYRLVFNRKRKLNQQGKALIQVEACLHKRKRYFSTHIYIYPCQWNPKKRKIRRHEHGESLNRMLDEFILSLEYKELESWKAGKKISLSLLEPKEVAVAGNDSFLSFYEHEVRVSSLKESTRRNRFTTLNLLKAFQSEIRFADLTPRFVSEFERYMKKRGYKVNTIAKHLKHLRIYVNKAIYGGYIPKEAEVFSHYHIHTQESARVFLTPEELERMEALVMDGKRQSWRHALDAFLFCCYTGLRYSDFTALTSRNIILMEGKVWLSFRSVKTGTLVQIPLELLFKGKALLILKRYEPEYGLFFKLKSNSAVDKLLVHIGRLARLDKKISFHSARHTNATLLLYKGVSLTTIQKLLGHRNIRTTQIYGQIMNMTVVKDLQMCEEQAR